MQHGFTRGLSCETQLAGLFHDLAATMDCRKETDLIFIDFQKAFDCVNHRILMNKLLNLGICLPVINVIKSFLTGRTQRVIVEGTISDPIQVTSGVPQGSCIGPLLFIIYINDLVPHLSSSCRLFADDLVIYRTMETINDQLALQQDLDSLLKWASGNDMDVNIAKSVAMTASRLREPNTTRNYSLGDRTLSRVNSYKYLGVMLTSELSWSEHVDYVVLKATRALGFVRRNLGPCSKNTKLKCYVTLIRPILEYAASVWDPFLASHTHLIESVQRRAARFICNNYNWESSVTNMLNELNLPDLRLRRKIARLSLLFKMDSGVIPLVLPSDVIRKEIRRTDNSKSYSLIACRSHPYYGSFFQKQLEIGTICRNK